MKCNLLSLALVVFTCSLNAQIFVNQDATGNNDGTSWENAFTSLSDGIDSAQVNSEIWVAKGKYLAGAIDSDPATTFFLINKTLHIFGGFAGTESSVLERDINANPTIVSGDFGDDDDPADPSINRADNGYHVFLLEAGSADGTTLDGFIIEGGNCRNGDVPMGADFTEWLGGGILTLAAGSINKCVFRNNGGANGSAMFSVGGVVLFMDSCKFENNISEFGTLRMANHFQSLVSNTDFIGNVSVNFGGAATIGNLNAVFDNCSFENNISETSIGGGLFIFQNSYSYVSNPSVEVNRSSFTGNEALVGAGLAMNNFFPGVELIVDDCIFNENVADVNDGAGGAIVIQTLDNNTGFTNSLDVFITRSSFTDNLAANAGGIVLFGEEDDLEILVDSCDFSNNSCNGTGGGLSILSDEFARVTATLSNLNFSGNTSGLGGGALFMANANDNPDERLRYTLTNSLFENNGTQNNGGAISAEPFSVLGPAGSIEKCDFINNAGTRCCGAIFLGSTETEITDCYFEGNSTNATNSNISGGGAIGTVISESTILQRCAFIGNHSEEDGSAVFFGGYLGQAVMKNVLVANNTGSNSIYNYDSLTLTNVTVVGSNIGLKLEEDAHVHMQNTIMANNDANLEKIEPSTISTMGGNMSNDDTFADYLTNYNGFLDYDDLDPLLDGNFIPTMDSPCVDAGNPEGIEVDALDLVGELRLQGNSIDIGCFETPFFATPVFEENQKLVSLYPNPFHDYIIINAEIDFENINLYDISGNMVQTFNSGEKVLIFNKNIPSGTYILEIEINGKIIKKKISKI